MSRQPFLSSAVVMLAGLLCSPFAGAEMAPLDDAGMAEVSGRGGIYLSGDISINELGGPIQNDYFGRCDEQDKKCGARLAYQLKEGRDSRHVCLRGAYLAGTFNRFRFWW